MIIHIIAFAVSLVAPKTAVRDSLLRSLTASELDLYVLTLRDAIASLTPRTADGPLKIALDPNIRKGTEPPIDHPWAQHLDSTSLRAVLRAGIHRLCEPLDGNTCRGEIRGMVLRLPEITFHNQDSARVVLLLTAARSEHDNSLVLGEVRYFVYEVSRHRGKWAIQWGRRGLPNLPPPN
jgi:hypothetical protein